MSIFDATMKIESQEVQIERSLAVLGEAMHYFESCNEHKYLPHYADRIYNLLCVTNNLLYDMMPELREVVDALLANHKEKKNG